MKKYITIASFLFVINAFSQPPAGYYNNANGKSCAALKTALKTILNTGNNPKSYAALKNQNATFEIKPRTVGVGSANVIYDIYSTNPNGVDPYQFTPTTDECGNYNGEGGCYNREHSVPQSWFGNGGGQPSAGEGTDFNHIFPTDGEVNARHGNNVYGEVANATWTSLTGNKVGSSSVAGITGTVFEPIDSFKGDLARAFFYFVTMYEDNMSSYSAYSDNSRAFAYNTFPSIKIDYLKMMIKWHKLDPVSTKERTRNNAAYTFQTNRNPFVDRPEWVDSVWNGNCPGLSALPVDIISFGGKLIDNNIALQWVVDNEINVKQYEVERSFNGVEYTKQFTIEANKNKTYNVADFVGKIDGRRVYYRIKKVDIDGKFSYSKIFTMHIPVLSKLEVYPNPVADFIKVKLSNNENSMATIFITDITGKNILQKNIQLQNGTATIDVDNIGNGTYLLQVLVNNEKWATKILINK